VCTHTGTVYPTNLGKRLWKIVHDKYQGDLAEALRFLIDAHTAGWSVAGEECYCHPKRKRDPEPLGNWFTHENTEKDIEWIYIFNEENNRVYIRDTGNDAEMIVELSVSRGERPLTVIPNPLTATRQGSSLLFHDVPNASENGAQIFPCD